MRSRINTGLVVNGGANTTLGRPGNSIAEKQRAFSGGSISIDSRNLESGQVYKDHLREERPLYKIIAERASSNDADQIDDNIFIGNSKSAQNKEWLTSKGIKYIVNTAKEIPNYFQDPRSDYRPRYLNTFLEDSPIAGGEDLLQILEPSFRYISNILKFDPQAKILIHCHMGKSRSASVLIYYLMRAKGLSFEDALAYVRSKRPIVAPNAWYTRQLEDADKILQMIKMQ